jgi:hypothetical protein
VRIENQRLMSRKKTPCSELVRLFVPIKAAGVPSMIPLHLLATAMYDEHNGRYQKHQKSLIEGHTIPEAQEHLI